jgi:predicted phosphohydrolase
MRLAVTSDLHLPITSFARIAAMYHEIAEFNPDAVVLAGDIGESLLDIEAVLKLFRQIDRPVLVIAGNHDLWNRDAPSQQLWEELLPQLVDSCGCHWLEAGVFTRDHVAVAGTIAWYDYSGADPTIHALPETFAREKGSFNNDAFLIDWPWSDIEFAARAAIPFLAMLDRLEKDPAVHRVIVVTHVPGLECQMTRRPHDRDWAFSNAYFGNLTLGHKIVAHSKVTHVISGHTHVGQTGLLELPDGRHVRARVIESEYRRPAWTGLIV